MSLREKIGSLLMLHEAGTSASQLREFVDRHALGGLIFMGDNIPNPESSLTTMTSALSSDAGLPVLIAIDQEGGTVRRVKSDDAASPRELRNRPLSETTQAFSQRAELLNMLGFSINFGVVADVTDDPSSFIYPRVLGTTTDDSSARVSSAVAGERNLVLTTLKHFPGHGVAPGDSHNSIPTTDMSYEAWRDAHAPPFASGIDAGAEVVMFGHLTFTDVDSAPASISLRWHEILRDDLGFEGVSITDDMRMLQDSGVEEFANPLENVVSAINAGNTMVLFVGGVEAEELIGALVHAVEDGRVSIETIDAAVHKLLVLRRELSGQSGPFTRCFQQCRELVD
ncbi:MAG: glycoside hydrolase family 3 N-terminal domain-containing protein [Microbacteriaceae bacterium]